MTAYIARQEGHGPFEPRGTTSMCSQPPLWTKWWFMDIVPPLTPLAGTKRTTGWCGSMFSSTVTRCHTQRGTGLSRWAA
jgi:hypothetical protein